MFKVTSLKLQAATLVVLQSIVSGGITIAPALARHHAQTTKAADAQALDATNQKLALAQGVNVQQSSEITADSKTHSKASVKLTRPSDHNYQDVENYNFDMAGGMPGVGI